MSRPLHERARAVIPGGVSSPARSFAAVESEPLFAVSCAGAMLTGDDGRTYLDYIQGFGGVILGHAHPLVVRAVTSASERGAVVGLTVPDEVRLAELVVERVPTVEKVRFVASGTEASMTAARIARAATGRPTIVKFEGCYHGHADVFLTEALSLPYNDVESLRSAFEHGRDEIAAVFVEPVATNMGVVLPDSEFLLALVHACRQHGALVVFDEVVTGFRLDPGGAQAAFGLEPDLTVLGKVVGGGLPVGAVGGRAELMDLLAPTGPVFQAGTYAAHPHAMAAGLATLEALTPDDLSELERKATVLAEGLQDAAGDRASVVRAATILSVHFAPHPPRNFAEVSAADRAAFARFHHALRERGVLTPPSPLEAWFPSVAHSDRHIEQTVEAARESLGS